MLHIDLTSGIFGFAAQALMQILRLKNFWWLFPTDNNTLLRLKGDAAFAVAAIAREVKNKYIHIHIYTYIYIFI